MWQAQRLPNQRILLRTLLKQLQHKSQLPSFGLERRGGGSPYEYNNSCRYRRNWYTRKLKYCGCRKSNRCHYRSNFGDSELSRWSVSSRKKNSINHLRPTQSTCIGLWWIAVPLSDILLEDQLNTTITLNHSGGVLLHELDPSYGIWGISDLGQSIMHAQHIECSI